MAKAFIAKVPHQKLIYDALNIASVPARMVKMILWSRKDVVPENEVACL